MELRVRAFGLAIGMFWGLAILLGTWWMLIVEAQGTIFSKISLFYIGYEVSWIGGIIGFLWSFVYGFIAGALIAWFYKIFCRKLYKAAA
jgi:hypothetical protein